MGLDMYLTKKTYVGGQYEHNKVKGIIDITKGGKRLNIDLKRVDYIDEQQAYWRKANAIHRRFVDNVQNGNDDCKQYEVSLDQLGKLLETCKKVVESLKGQKLQKKTITNWRGENEEVAEYKDVSLAQKLLPPTEGFFFGSTVINEDYVQDLENTIKQLSDLDENADYYYQSSW